MGSFDQDTVTDRKRLVRGEQWRGARTYLRSRDAVHNRRWRVLTLAGGAPKEEIDTIRSLMPSAEIICIDRDAKCCEAAADAGADNVVMCDLFDFPDRRKGPGERGGLSGPIPPEIERLGDRLDVVNLDFCGVITPAMEVAMYRYSRLIRGKRDGGVLMVTFAYGRDVIERMDMESRYKGLPGLIGGRVSLLDRSLGQVGGSHRLASVVVYRGPSMPMCSAMWVPNHIIGMVPNPSFVTAEDDDLMVASVDPPDDPSLLYALPAERILAFKRKWQALKAVATRKLRESKKGTPDDGGEDV